MKKIKSYLKQNYKRLVIQVVSIISAFVIFTVPVFATEYSLEWQMYLGDGYNNLNPGGIYFYIYNRTEGEYVCLTTKNQFDDKWFRGTWVDQKYTSASVIFNQPVDPNEFQRVFGGSAIEKFYIEFPAAFHFGSTSKDYLGPTNLYLGTLDFVVMEDGTEVKYTVKLDEDSFKNNNSLQSLHTTIGFTVTPSVPLSNISYVAFNFDFIPQYDRFYIQARPNGSVKIKTGDNIPAYAPVASTKIDNLDSVETEIMYNTQAGIVEGENIFKNAGNVFGKTSVVGKSVMAATKIFNALLKTDVFNDILNVALTLGIFAFLLGLGGVAASLWNKHDRNNKGG